MEKKKNNAVEKAEKMQKPKQKQEEGFAKEENSASAKNTKKQTKKQIKQEQPKKEQKSTRPQHYQLTKNTIFAHVFTTH